MSAGKETGRQSGTLRPEVRRQVPEWDPVLPPVEFPDLVAECVYFFQEAIRPVGRIIAFKIHALNAVAER